MGFPGVFDYWNGVLLTTCRKEGTRKDIVTLLLQFGPSPGIILRISWTSDLWLLNKPECDGGSHWNFNRVRILAGDELEEFFEGLPVLVAVVGEDIHIVCWHPPITIKPSQWDENKHNPPCLRIISLLPAFMLCHHCVRRLGFSSNLFATYNFFGAILTYSGPFLLYTTNTYRAQSFPIITSSNGPARFGATRRPIVKNVWIIFGSKCFEKLVG